jgi:hypothetical protein
VDAGRPAGALAAVLACAWLAACAHAPRALLARCLHPCARRLRRPLRARLLACPRAPRPHPAQEAACASLSKLLRARGPGAARAALASGAVLALLDRLHNAVVPQPPPRAPDGGDGGGAADPPAGGELGGGDGALEAEWVASGASALCELLARADSAELAHALRLGALDRACELLRASEQPRMLVHALRAVALLVRARPSPPSPAVGGAAAAAEPAGGEVAARAEAAEAAAADAASLCRSDLRYALDARLQTSGALDAVQVGALTTRAHARARTRSPTRACCAERGLGRGRLKRSSSRRYACHLGSLRLRSAAAC